MSGINLLVFLSSVREPRNADRVFKLVSKLATEKGFEVDVLDPLKENLPMVKTPLHFYPDQNEAPQQLRDLNEKIISADAYMFITAEYNAGVPPALLNLIDHMPPPSFSFKSAGIVSYSAGNGGRLSTSHLTDTLVYLGCMVQPFIVPITTVEDAVSDDGEALKEHLKENINTLLSQIEFTGMAMKNEKQSGQLKLPRLNSQF